MDAKTINIVRSLLTSALEGGSNYWYQNLKPGTIPPGTAFDDYRLNGKCQPRCEDGSEDYHHWGELLPTVEGGSVTVDVDENEDGNPKEYVIDLPTLQRGLDVMREKYVKRWAEAMDPADGGDADTGDCFLQCCLFGEVIFS
jgi:hypothetical protein